jgi:hypothetical protein
VHYGGASLETGAGANMFCPSLHWSNSAHRCTQRQLLEMASDASLIQAHHIHLVPECELGCE